MEKMGFGVMEGAFQRGLVWRLRVKPRRWCVAMAETLPPRTGLARGLLLSGGRAGLFRGLRGARPDLVASSLALERRGDYLLVFCPIASRVGTDISEALDNMPGDKPAILVVMHHTFSPDHVVAPSMRQVNNPNVLLTVDCLFYERDLLKCNRNDIAWYDVQKFLGIPLSQDSIWNYLGSCWRKNWKLVIAGGCIVVVIIVLTTYFEAIKK